jgi:hypothetical protein
MALSFASVCQREVDAIGRSVHHHKTSKTNVIFWLAFTGRNPNKPEYPETSPDLF